MIVGRDQLRAQLPGDLHHDREPHSGRARDLKAGGQAISAVGHRQPQPGILIAPAPDVDGSAACAAVGVLPRIDGELVDRDGQLLSHVARYVDRVGVDCAVQAGAERDVRTNFLEKVLQVDWFEGAVAIEISVEPGNGGDAGTDRRQGVLSVFVAETPRTQGQIGRRDLQVVGDAMIKFDEFTFALEDKRPGLRQLTFAPWTNTFPHAAHIYLM